MSTLRVSKERTSSPPSPASARVAVFLSRPCVVPAPPIDIPLEPRAGGGWVGSCTLDAAFRHPLNSLVRLPPDAGSASGCGVSVIFDRVSPEEPFEAPSFHSAVGCRSQRENSSARAGSVSNGEMVASGVHRSSSSYEVASLRPTSLQEVIDA